MIKQKITQSVVDGLDVFTQKIKNIPNSTFILLYILLAICCAIYMVGLRRKMITDSKKAKSTKRDKAIEKFANYKQELIDEYALTCQDDIQQLVDTENNKVRDTLETVYYNNLLIENILQQTPNGKEELIKTFLLNPNPDETDLNTDLEEYTKNLLKTTNTFIEENAEKLQFNDMIITNYISLLNDGITTYFNTVFADKMNNLLDTKTFDTRKVLSEFIKEVNYRLFFSLRNLSRKEYVKQCKNKDQLTSTDTGIYNKELLDKINYQDEYRKNILYVMTYLIGEDNILKQEAQKEYNKLQSENIQPNSEKVLTNIRNASKNLTNQADYYSGKITGEFDLGNAFANQYNNYVANQSKTDLEMLVNPVSAIDNLEQGTLSFLEKIQNKINNNSKQITSKSPAINMLNNTVMTNNNTIFNNNIDTTNIGSLLVKTPSTTSQQSKIQLGNSINTSNINKNNSFNNINNINNRRKNNKVIEGFETIVQEEQVIQEEEIQKTSNNQLTKDIQLNNPKPKKSNDTNLTNLDKAVSGNLMETSNYFLQIVNSFMKYLNENILPLFADTETRKAVLDLFQQEENSIPFGILLIGLSIMLFFIQISSSD